MRTLKLCVIFSTVLLSTFSAFAQEITVAAAADLQFAMQDIAARFEKDTGKKVKVVYGSSGNFYQQIQNGAPFDAFFSANLDYAKKLEAAGLAEPGTLYQYAPGKIVLWVPSASKADLADGLKALAGPGARKVSIANPEHAPYGHAAVAALQKENLYEQVKSKLVMGENISQAASFVLSGSADAGIIALSLALAPNMKDKGRYVEVPAGDYPPIEQGSIVLKASSKKDAARAFLEYLKTPASAELLKNYGFGVK
jgi:molybdate transport system substrate-binding protein